MIFCGGGAGNDCACARAVSVRTRACLYPRVLASVRALELASALYSRGCTARMSDCERACVRARASAGVFVLCWWRVCRLRTCVLRVPSRTRKSRLHHRGGGGRWYQVR